MYESVHFYEMSRIGSSIETEIRLAVARVWGREVGGVTSNDFLSGAIKCSAVR